MHEHGPDCLEGPIRGSHAWWRGLAPVHGPVGYPAQTSGKRAAQEDTDIRRDLVERVRREIQAGTYDTSEKWQAALDGLLECLDQD
jgi:hypothetical protein